MGWVDTARSVGATGAQGQPAGRMLLQGAEAAQVHRALAAAGHERHRPLYDVSAEQARLADEFLQACPLYHLKTVLPQTRTSTVMLLSAAPLG